MKCRRCRGTGIDPDLKQRYTTGGHNDRSCSACYGDGVVNCTKEVTVFTYKLYNEASKKYVTVDQYKRAISGVLYPSVNLAATDVVFTDPVDAHCAAYDLDDATTAPINVVSFDDNGEIC